MKAQKKKQPLSEQSLRELAGLKTESSRKKFIAAHKRLFDDSVVRQLNEVVRTKLREDPHEALFLAEASVVIARRLRNQEALGRSLRSKANSLYMLGDNQAGAGVPRRGVAYFSGNRQIPKKKPAL